MTRLLLLALLVLAMTAPAGAEMIRCRTADGTLLFTEDPSQVPADCQPVELGGGGTMNIMPSPDVAPSDLRKAEGAEVANEPVPGAAPETTAETTAETEPVPEAVRLRADAEDMVARYQDAQQRRRRESFMTAKQAAMREMAEIQAEKAKMLGGLAASGLDSAEQKQIRSILDAIPAP